jgi:hypothetical protein
MLVLPSFGPAQRHPTTPAEAARFFASVAENGAARRVLLLRPARLPGWPACTASAGALRAVLDPVLALPGLVWNDLPDGDSLAIWRRGGEAEVAAVQAAVAATPGVAAVFDVPADLAALQLALAAIAAEHGHAAPSVAQGPPPVPVTLDDLAAVERVIGQVELLDRVSGHPVWSFGEGGQKTLAMQWLGLDLQGLVDVLVPGRSLAPEPAIRARLWRIVSRRLLGQLAARHEIASGGTISVPCDCAALLSPEFGRFDTSLPARLRGRIVLEIPLAQAVASVAAFTMAARIAAAADVPVCLSGVRPEHLPGITPLAHGATWLRLEACDSLAPEVLRARIPAQLLPRMIAADVSDPASLAVLRAAGVGMFAGRAAEAA